MLWHSCIDTLGQKRGEQCEEGWEKSILDTDVYRRESQCRKGREAAHSQMRNSLLRDGPYHVPPRCVLIHCSDESPMMAANVKLKMETDGNAFTA